MATDFVPRTEEDFNDWQGNYLPKLVANAVAWGIPPAVVLNNQNAGTDWTAKYAVGNDEADPTSAQRQAKNDSRKAFTLIIRSTVKQYITPNPAVTNADRLDLGVTVPDTTRSRVPVPDHPPVQIINKIIHKQHELRITDPDNPATKSKPKGVARINVFRYIGTAPPVNISQYSLIGSATKAKFVSKLDDEDVGKKAFYITQYENTRGERGPVSDSINATVA